MTTTTSSSEGRVYRAFSEPTFNILLISGNKTRAKEMAQHLIEFQIDVLHVSNHTEAEDCFLALDFDAVMLDLKVASRQIEVGKLIRQSRDLPIIALDSDDDNQQRIAGLNAGIDDYLRADLDFRELAARVRAHARRHKGLLKPAHVFAVGALEIDEGAHIAKLRGKRLSLSDQEFLLLRELAANCGRVMTRAELLERAKASPGLSFDRSIDVRISRLRQKLGDSSRTPTILLTIRGVGYMLANTQ